MSLMYEMIAGMYKSKKMTKSQVLASVKGKHITEEQAKTILGVDFPTDDSAPPAEGSALAKKETAPRRSRKSK